MTDVPPAASDGMVVLEDAERKAVRRTIIGWTAVCPLVLVATVFYTFGTTLDRLVSTGGPTETEFALSYAFSLIVLLVPTIGVTVACVRHLRRRTLDVAVLIPCLIFAVSCAGLGSIATVPLLADAVGNEIRVAIIKAKDPTPRETSTTPAELGLEARRFIDETAGTIADAVEVDPDSSFPSEYCSLSNLERGAMYPSYGRLYIFTTSASEEAAISAIADHWTEQGYTTEVVPGEENTNGAPSVRARGGIIAFAAAFYQSSAEGDRILLDFETICVAE